MICIHRKDWDAQLLEALIAERMKPSIHAAIPKIQVGCKSGHSRIEYLVLLKTWILDIEEKNGQGLYKGFDMENNFDKESLLDTLHTLYTEGNISDKDYRMWYELNCKTCISNNSR